MIKMLAYLLYDLAFNLVQLNSITQFSNHKQSNTFQQEKYSFSAFQAYGIWNK